MSDTLTPADTPPFYPTAAPVPDQLETDEFRLRMLSTRDVELDYAAVMASQAQLLVRSAGRWPRAGFTLAENLADLDRHERDHLARTSFTYTVMNLPETECLGCVYISPLAELLAIPDVQVTGPPAGPYQAEVSWWASSPHLVENLDARLLAALIPWLRDAWAFTWAGFRANQHEHRHLQLYEAAWLAVRYTIDIPREPGRYYLYG
jgi:hypothetical protein